MPGPRATEITLSAEEQAALEQLVRRHTTPQQIALRARIILAAAQGQTNNAIHAEQGVAVNTVRLWRKRWVALQSIALADLSADVTLHAIMYQGFTPMMYQQFTAIMYHPFTPMMYQ